MQAPTPIDIRLMNATAALLFVLTALAFVWLAARLGVRTPVFSIHSIRVDGEVGRNSVATIRANAAPKLKGNLFTLDLGDAQRAFQSVPWVRHATVQRVWPDRLAVQLEEHRPAALWVAEKGEDKLVNTYRRSVRGQPGRRRGRLACPRWRGPAAARARCFALYRTLAPVFGRLDAKLETLTLPSAATGMPNSTRAPRSSSAAARPMK
jgi:cell division protein FtsQ